MLINVIALFPILNGATLSRISSLNFTTCHKMEIAIYHEDVPAILHHLNLGINPYLFEGYGRSPMYWAMFYIF